MSDDTRDVAKEAAFLLYRRHANEYIEAKRLAAKNLGTKALPSNFEVALQLDIIADEFERDNRRERLIGMRKTALDAMRALQRSHPRLIGSVWRGTANVNSDIDIVVYSDNPKQAALALIQVGAKNLTFENRTHNSSGSQRSSTHILARMHPSWDLEVIVRPLEELGRTEICDIYGDEKVGLDLRELAEVLEKMPDKRFVPVRRRRRQ